MFTIERLRPTTEHFKRYLDLLAVSQNNPEVIRYLPEIFDETEPEHVRDSVQVVSRYFIKYADKDIGRVEYTTHLNADPSVVSKVPAGVLLGYNACYFINPSGISDIEEAHRLVAAKVIDGAFAMQTDDRQVPWLPVAPEHDPSRGWLYQADAATFDVHVGEPVTGWFEQFGVGDEAFQLAYATKK